MYKILQIPDGNFFVLSNGMNSFKTYEEALIRLDIGLAFYKKLGYPKEGVKYLDLCYYEIMEL